jgi:hypothetical protein
VYLLRGSGGLFITTLAASPTWPMLPASALSQSTPLAEFTQYIAGTRPIMAFCSSPGDDGERVPDYGMTWFPASHSRKCRATFRRSSR